MENNLWIWLVIFAIAPVVAGVARKYVPKWLRITIAVVSIAAFIGVLLWGAM